MNEVLCNAIEQIVSASNVLKNEPMSRHTTFRSGGPASLFIRPENKDQLVEVMALIRKLGTDFFVLGNGSNLLVSDEGFDGVVISLSNLNDISLKGDHTILAEAGALNSQIAAFARDNELKNFEFAAGIPGTIGGAMIMNAGAYGGEMKLVTKSVTVLSPEGEIMVLDNDSMEFGYRSSAIKGRGYIVISVLLSLKKGKKETIIQNMQELAAKRREKQPLEFPSAGSTFKRPEGYFAGKLIEDAGLRGFSVGGAAVSEKHCGFVINKDNATSAQIYELISEVKRRVYENSGVKLEPEVIMLGKF
ncbi:UDP-N-acetylmuramate dehydrogenase [Butyrivibrio proteoclasticus]|uniref:UDP-N-acetylenolpyruvoylglucosamine reductase n=1 Tax=Butyrivibrio proteoclasticus TaxID=43305 RepID=A0A1I5V7N1_9FIRM|nr:UDP-N-acetylmuramate dehydrogenase [Butyrivibrio proteoclasticus]SFQ03564.1 UDP-N-acetylmuramate dehydrogenase [Butyrivibrio proteoclasticus]